MDQFCLVTLLESLDYEHLIKLKMINDDDKDNEQTCFITHICFESVTK